MKKFKHFILFFLFILSVQSLIIKAEDVVYKESINKYFDYFDTYISIQVWDTVEYNPGDDTTPTDPFWTGLETVLQHIQDTFQTDTNYTPTGGVAPLEEQSELYQLNQSAGSGTPFHCSDDLYEIIKLGIQFAEETNGKLDPAIGPLVNLWDINAHAGEEYPIPLKTQIDPLLPLVDYQLIQFDDTNKTVLLPEAGMSLNLGAISKGFAADKVYEYFQSQGIEHAMINLGGNIYAMGNRFAQRTDGTYNWLIGVNDPRIDGSSNSIATVNVIDKTVVTSGIYERYIIDPNTGIYYSHILDPDTGYSVDNNLACVSIITNNSARADALSTSLFALGLDDGLKFIENDPNVDAVFITKDNKVYISSGMQTKYNFKITNNDFTLVNATNPTTNNPSINTIILVGVTIVVVVAGTIFVGKKLMKKYGVK